MVHWVLALLLFMHGGAISMRYGTIVSYFTDKKFGFIKPDVGNDVFFHVSALAEESAQTEIKVGQPVKYELTPRHEIEKSANSAGPAGGRSGPAQPKAKLVAILDKLPGASLAETSDPDRAGRHARARKKKPTWRR